MDRHLLDREGPWQPAAGAARGTQEAIQGYAARLTKDFKGLDGLMAVFEFLETEKTLAESSSSIVQGASSHLLDGANTSAPTYPTAIDLEEEDDDQSVTAAGDPILHGPVPTTAPTAAPAPRPAPVPAPELGAVMARQWEMMRSLVGELEHHHRRFESHARNSKNPILSALRVTYTDVKAVHDQGLLALRKICDSMDFPRALKQIFPLVSISYAISKLLVQHRSFDERDILSGLHLWKEAIKNSKEKEAFTILALALWPEAKRHLNGFPVPAVANTGDRSPRDRVPNGQQSAPPPLDEYPSYDLAGSGTRSPQPGFHNADLVGLGGSPGMATTLDWTNPPWADIFLNLDSVQAQDINPSNVALGPETHAETSNGRVNNMHQEEGRWYLTSGVSSAQAPPQPAHPAATVPPIDKGKAPETIDLCDTGVFTVFLTFYKETRELLRILGGRGVMPKPERVYSMEKDELKKFYKEAKAVYFTPRLRTTRPVPYAALLSIAEMFTKMGCLRSIAEIKSYLVSVATAYFRFGDEHLRFVAWAMSDSIAETRTWHCDESGCSRKYKSSSGLSKHKAKDHNGRPRVTCPKCDFQNVERWVVRDHFKSKHPGLDLPNELEKMLRGPAASRQRAGRAASRHV